MVLTSSLVVAAGGAFAGNGSEPAVRTDLYPIDQTEIFDVTEVEITVSITVKV